jgi:MFS family permease
MFAPVNSMAAEYANNKRRGLAIGLNVLGYPLGTTIGGLIASWMLDRTGNDLASLIASSVVGEKVTGLGLGWQSVFILGAALTAALIPLVLLFMPESMEFLLSKRPKNALTQINVLMKKLGHAPLTELPPKDAEAQLAGGLAQILKQPYLARTIIIIVAYFMTISVFYFGNFLAPRVLSQIGFDPSTARLAAISITVGGMIGSLVFGILAAPGQRVHLDGRFDLDRLLHQRGDRRLLHGDGRCLPGSPAGDGIGLHARHRPLRRHGRPVRRRHAPGRQLRVRHGLSHRGADHVDLGGLHAVLRVDDPRMAKGASLAHSR